MDMYYLTIPALYTPRTNTHNFVDRVTGVLAQDVLAADHRFLFLLITIDLFATTRKPRTRAETVRRGPRPKYVCVHIRKNIHIYHLHIHLKNSREARRTGRDPPAARAHPHWLSRSPPFN